MAEPAPLALVTGATGLLGAHLVNVLLAEGYRVRVLTRDAAQVQALARAAPGWRPHEVVAGDIRDPIARQRAVAGIGLLFHACHSHEYWRPNADVYAVNVTATEALLDDVRAASPGCAVVFSSSTSTLRDEGVAYYPTAAERIPRRYFNSLTKLWAERAAEQTAAEHGLDLRVVHLPYIIGPLDLRPTPLRMFIPAALQVPLPLAPAGGCRVAAASEVARAHLVLAQRGRNGERVVIEGTPVRYTDYVRLANEAAGRTLCPASIPPAVLRGLAVGRVFDRWAAERMSRVSFSPGTTAHGAEALRPHVFATADWFRAHPIYGGPWDVLRYLRRFI